MKVELVTNLKRQATKILTELHLSKEPVQYLREEPIAKVKPERK